MAGGWALALKNLFMPQYCRQCGERILTEENPHYCPACWEESPRIERPLCGICGHPHPPGVGLLTPITAQAFPCGPCAVRTDDRQWRRTIGAARYEGPVGEAIRLLKFHGRVNLVQPLAALLEGPIYRELTPEAYDYIVPVPLHRVRQRERGYNQSALIAEAILPWFAKARLDESLRRIRPTLTQSLQPDARARRESIRGAFAVENGGHLAGSEVLLVDDVVTTHGTVTECASALVGAGVKAVDVLAVALAVRGRFFK